MDFEKISNDEVEEIFRVLNNEPNIHKEEDNSINIDNKGFLVKLSIKNKDIFLISKDYIEHVNQTINRLENELKACKYKISALEYSQKTNSNSINRLESDLRRILNRF